MSLDIISVDPGLAGGISLLEENKEPIVYKIPVKKTIVNKKNKNIYDIVKIIDIFNKYKNKEVLFIIEKDWLWAILTPFVILPLTMWFLDVLMGFIMAIVFGVASVVSNRK